MRRAIVLTLAASAAAWFVIPAVPTLAADWPCYLGPTGNHAAAPFDGPMVERWADARVAWVSDEPIPDGMSGDGRGPRGGRFAVSGGYGSPVIAAGRVYLQYTLPSGDVASEEHVAKYGEATRPKFLVEADDVVHAFDVATGKTAWKAVRPRTAMNMQGFTKGGPSLTCCVAGGRIFAHSCGGRVFAFDAKTGDLVWETKTDRYPFQETLRAWAVERKRIPAYNRDFKTSPAVIGGVLVLNDHRYHKTMAASGWEYFYDEPSNLLALDPATGEELWRLPGGLSNGANPVPWKAGDTWCVIANGGSGGGIRCIEVRTGRVRWTAASGGGRTVCVGGDILVADGGEGKSRYHVGYRMAPDGAEEIWRLPGTYGSPSHASPAVAGDHWISETKPRGKLLWVELATGRIADTAPAEKEGHFGYFPRVMGTRVVCGGADTDQLHLYAVGPDGLRLLDDARIPNAWGYETGVLPALADGRMVFRTHDRLVCLDLRKGATAGTPLGETDLMAKPGEAEAAAEAKRGTEPKAGPTAEPGMPKLDDIGVELR